MQIIKRMPIPTYEIECQECGSVIHFRAAESQRDQIACPVCGVTVWTMNARKLEGHADPSDVAPPMTHGDKLRAKNDEELARWIADRSFDCPPGFSPAPLGCDDVCVECWLDWLKEEVKDE